MKIQTSLLQLFIATIVAVPLLDAGTAQAAKRAELTGAQAITRVKAILRNNVSSCQITKTQSVSAIRAKAGWRVTARIKMSVSGTSTTETAVWIVSAKTGASAQNQLTAEIANGCP